MIISRHQRLTHAHTRTHAHTHKNNTKCIHAQYMAYVKHVCTCVYYIQVAHFKILMGSFVFSVFLKVKIPFIIDPLRFLSVRLTIHPYVHLHTCTLLSVCPIVLTSVCPFVLTSIRPFALTSICPFVLTSIRPFVLMSTRPFALTYLLCPYFHPSVGSSLHPSDRSSLRPSFRLPLRLSVRSFLRSSVRSCYRPFNRPPFCPFVLSTVHPSVRSLACWFALPAVRLTVSPSEWR